VLQAVWSTLRWTLRQRRYASLSAAALVVALVCVGVGTFEIHRYREKVHQNATLVANASAPARPLTTTLVPLVGQHPRPSANAIRYRSVSVTGHYLADREQYVANKSQGGRQGFWVLTPLQTSSGAVLVARGFVAATASETRPAVVPAAPSGSVTIIGRLQAPDTSNDQLGRLGHGEIMSINPSQQAARTSAPIYDAYVILKARQPGATGLAALPGPDLSNPTGGAEEWQLLSYVVQWYAFAVLALLIPFLVARNEVREARRRYLGIDSDATEIDDDVDEAVPALGAGHAGAVPALRDAGALARRSEAQQAEWAWADRLADRYGRSLGDASPAEIARAMRRRAVPDVPTTPVPRSGDVPHRSGDAYHGSYNDMLWRLAMAEKKMPDPFAAESQQDTLERPPQHPPRRPVLRPDGSVDDEAPGEDGPVP
jgi:cytochrome oxidase assembly protein ShyY1